MSTLPPRVLATLRPGRTLSIMRHTVPDAAAPTIFFVHGSCANAMQFREQMGWCVARGVPFVAYDALGCGEVRHTYSHKGTVPKARASALTRVSTHAHVPSPYTHTHTRAHFCASTQGGRDRFDCYHPLWPLEGVW